MANIEDKKWHISSLAYNIAEQNLLRQRILCVDVLNEKTLDGLHDQHAKLGRQLIGILKGALLATFFSFVAFNGSDIQIFGTKSNLTSIPAFLELSVLCASFFLVLLPFGLASMSIVSSYASALSVELSAQGALDPSILSYSKHPNWAVFKFIYDFGSDATYSDINVGRMGQIYLTTAKVVALAIVIFPYLILVGSVGYIASQGLPHTFFANAVAAFSLICCVLSILLMLLVVSAFTFTVDLDRQFYSTRKELDPLPKPHFPFHYLATEIDDDS